MLPIEESWYKRLPLAALALGAAGGVASVVFMTVTGVGIDFFFGNTATGWWAGQWSWIPLTAVGGFVVAWLRKMWRVPKDVPSPIALAHQAWV